MAIEKARTTAKDFFLWVGAMVAFYWSIVAFIFLIFDYINYAMPNALSSYPANPYQSGIPYEMASIIVLFPAYLLLMWLIRRDISKDRSRAEIWVRRWVLIFTLFVAGVTVAGDLIVLLTAFLRGDEITLAFMLKVVVVLLVAAGVFMHFIADIWGYWEQYPSRRMSVFFGVIVLALASIVGGFFIVGTPQQARQMQFDEQRVNDLQSIQYQIVNYYQSKQVLPASLTDLNDSISGFSAPLDAQTHQAYEYHATGKLTFELCANFNSVSGANPQNNIAYPTMPYAPGSKGQDNWQHAAGHVCFARTIDPQLYPPIKGAAAGTYPAGSPIPTDINNAAR